MADRYDLKVARRGRDGKTFWTKVGVMFPMKDRDGYSLTFEALPIGGLNDRGEFECRVVAWEPYKDDRPSRHNRAKADGYQPDRAADLDDEIPF